MLPQDIATIRKLFAGVPEKVFVKDLTSTYVYCNDPYAAYLGIAAEDIAGKTDFDLYSEELAEKYRADDREVIKTGEAKSVEEICAAEGQDIAVRTMKTPVRDDQGKPAGLMGMFWDITAYKEAEASHKLKSAVLEAINTIFMKGLTCETEKDLAATCLRVVEEITESKFGYIGEINTHGRFDTIAMSNPGWSECKLPESEATRIIMNMEIRGLWGCVLRDEKPLITNSPSTHPDRVGVPEGHPPLTSFLGVPLKERGKTTGMIALANKTGGYDENDLKAVEDISVAVVEVLRNWRLRQKYNEQAKEILELSTPVIQVWQGVLIAPLIGVLDSERTQLFMERFLTSIVKTKSTVALVDITGVPTVDTQTAQHVIEAITAARLLGTRVILTGVRAPIAQTIVHLGIDLAEIETCASLAAGFQKAMEMLNLEVTEKKQTSDT